ncbi:hypothetical protein KY317_00655 [Candidatus Woesearchaeota archaeon]|nr:hypothetical protein [Candidatus Woesearchaeota archaeon]
MKRKSQIAGEIFIWILALFILAVIVFYGYKAISGFMQRGEEVSFIQFKNNLESEITVLSTQLNDVVVFNERNPLRIPSKYKEVCFVSENAVEGETENRIIKEAIKAGIHKTTENVFLEPPAANPVYVGKIEMDNGILCVPVVKGRIDIRLTGRGGATLIEKI